MIEEKETWKDIPGYEGYYQASNFGNVRSLDRISKTKNGKELNLKGVTLKQGLSNGNYLTVALVKDGKQRSFTVHSLIAMTFLNHKPKGYNKVVNHKNFVKIDNRVENIEVVSQRENSNQAHLPSLSNYVGVVFDKSANKWLSRIIFNNKRYHLGSFDDEEEANKYYQDALISIETGTEIKLKRNTYSSKYVGVNFNNEINKWQSRVTINGKRKSLGYFHNEYDAHLARQNELKRADND